MTPDAALLLSWYDRHRRTMPWRQDRPDPYQVWLSEVMLQQTTVTAVGPRFLRFLARFPNVQALAEAPISDVLEEWAGLGYYARARNLHACARAVAALGSFPRTAQALRTLPGIGMYTAAAVAAIAFREPVVPLDGNVERVVARLFAITEALPAARPAIDRQAQAFMAQHVASRRPGDFAQALFDLGATICTPRAPACALCPWRESCQARTQGIAATLPQKAAKPKRPLRSGVHFLVSDSLGQVLVRRRPPSGLLGGMLEFPGTPWREMPWTAAEAVTYAPMPDIAWSPRNGIAQHGFTHFQLEMSLWTTEVAKLEPPDGMLARPLSEIRSVLPTVMRRLLDLM